MMRMRMPRSMPVLALARLAVLGLAFALLQGCASGDLVKVINKSPTALTDVVVSGNGLSKRFGTIPAGGAETLRVRPRGESGLRVEFEANGRRYSSSREALEDDHLERAEITINADYSIVIEINPP